MEMNAPALRNAIDANRQGLIGQPIDRVEGRLKVTGKAPYAHEVQEGGNAAFLNIGAGRAPISRWSKLIEDLVFVSFKKNFSTDRGKSSFVFFVYQRELLYNSVLVKIQSL